MIIYGHNFKKEEKRNNVSGQKQRQRDREIVSESALESGFPVSEKFKQVFRQAGYRSAEIQGGYFR